MTTDRGVVHGRVPSTPPQRRGPIHVVALPSLLVAAFTAGVIIASLGAYGGDDGRRLAAAPSDSPVAVASPSAVPTSSPEPIVLPTPSPSLVPPTPSASGSPVSATPPPFGSLNADASPIADVVDPYQLPRFPGADVVGSEQGLDGSVRWTLIEYAIAASTQDDVREHYRTVFRETDWFVGDVDFVDGVWTFAASQDLREAQLEISVDDDTVLVAAYITEVEPTLAPAPTPRAIRHRDRSTQRDRIPAGEPPATRAEP